MLDCVWCAAEYANAHHIPLAPHERHTDHIVEAVASATCGHVTKGYGAPPGSCRVEVENGDAAHDAAAALPPAVPPKDVSLKEKDSYSSVFSQPE